jgi:cathepsin D
MGLAWPALAQTEAAPFWLTLAESNTLASPLFAFYLARYDNVSSVDPDSSEPSGGSLSIGSVNTSLYTGSINYISLTQQSYWLIPMQSAQIGTAKLTLSSSNAVIDT